MLGNPTPMGTQVDNELRGCSKLNPHKLGPHCSHMSSYDSHMVLSWGLGFPKSFVCHLHVGTYQVCNYRRISIVLPYDSRIYIEALCTRLHTCTSTKHQYSKEHAMSSLDGLGF